MEKEEVRTQETEHRGILEVLLEVEAAVVTTLPKEVAIIHTTIASTTDKHPILRHTVEVLMDITVHTTVITGTISGLIRLHHIIMETVDLAGLLLTRTHRRGNRGIVSNLTWLQCPFLKKGKKKTNGGQFALGHKKSAVFWIVRCFFFTFVYTQECMLYTIGIIQTG